MTSNLPQTQKTDWVNNDIVKPADTNGWGEAINTLTEDIPIYASTGNFYNVVSFTSNKITLEPVSFADSTQNETVDSYIDGMVVNFKSNFYNNGVTTVDVNNLGEKTIYNSDGTNLAENDIISGQFVQLRYNSSQNCFYMVTLGQTLPNQLGHAGEALYTDGFVSYWQSIPQGANQSLNNLNDQGNAKLQYAPFSINNGTVDNDGNNATLYTPTAPLYYKRNINVIGTLTINDSVISGFSGINYGQINNDFNPASTDTWEVVFNVTTGDSVTTTTAQYVISNGTKDRPYYYGMCIYVYNSKFSFTIGRGSTYSDIQGITSISPNTHYQVKLACDGANAYSLYLKSDSDNDFNLENSVSNITMAYSSTYNYNPLIGTYYGNTVGYTYSWDGSIDLNNSYIKINNQVWWTGIIDGTSSDYDYVIASGNTLISNPCTITTADGRTKAFTTSATLDCSSLADGEYRIYKNYTDGSLLTDMISWNTDRSLPLQLFPVKNLGCNISKNGVASGFSAYNYLQLPNNFDVSNGETWETVIDFTTGSDVNTIQCIYSVTNSNTSNLYDALLFAVNTNNLLIYFSSNGTSFDIANAVHLIDNISTNTNFQIKIEFTGTSYIVTDLINNTILVTITSSTSIYANNTNVPFFGLRGKNGYSQEFLGTINIKNSYIKINNETWWSGNEDKSNLVYLGNVTIASGAISSISNCGFNQFYTDTIITSAYELDVDNALQISTTLQTAYIDYTPTKSGLFVIIVGSGTTSNTSNSVTAYIQAVDSNGNILILDGAQIVKPTGTGSITHVAQSVVFKGKPYQYYMSAVGTTKSGSAVFIPFKNAN